MAAAKQFTLVLDSGAFIAAERRDPLIAEWLRVAQRNGARVVVPASVLAEVWREKPAWGIGQLRISANTIDALNDEAACQVGVLNGRTGRSQIVDAHVAITAYQYAPAVILTSDPNDIISLGHALGSRVSVGQAQRSQQGDIHIEQI